MNKAQMLAQTLDDFLSVSPEVDASAVVSADGLPMASALPPGVEEDRLAAMSAALLTLGDRAAAGLGKGELQQVFIEGSHGHVILMAAGTDAVLVAVTGRGSKIGLVLFEMRKAAAKVGEIMASTPVDEHQQAPAPEAAPELEHAPQPPRYDDAPLYSDSSFSNGPQYPESVSVRHPEPTPAAEVIQPSVSAWE